MRIGGMDEGEIRGWFRSTAASREGEKQEQNPHAHDVLLVRILQARGNSRVAEKVAEMASHADMPDEDDAVSRPLDALDERPKRIDAARHVETMVVSRLARNDDAPLTGARPLVELDHPHSVSIVDPLAPNGAEPLAGSTIDGHHILDDARGERLGTAPADHEIVP